jgi:predicted aldo/keto reductase-like oxidoreductase
MERRTFGNTDLEVSAISLGCWIFGVNWWGHYTQEDANRLCSFSYDRGITYFDNGDAYGNGRAEELFGNWMKSAGVALLRCARWKSMLNVSVPVAGRVIAGDWMDVSPLSRSL